VKLVALYVTVAATGVVVPCAARVNVVAEIVPAFMASENEAVTALLVAIAEAPAAGETVETAGGVVSTAMVVNVQILSEARALFAVSFTPLAPPLTVAV
jgi:hypothetical protein